MTFSGYILVTLMSKWTPKVTKSYIYFGILWHTLTYNKNSGKPVFFRLSAYFMRVCVTGFEPTTFWSVASRSLSYLPDL